MAFIELEYILEEKQIDNNKTIEQLALEYFIKTGFELHEDHFETGNGGIVLFSFDNKRNSYRYYLRLSTKMTIHKAIEILLQFDDSIMKSDFNKYVSVHKVYDGISGALCEKLYPKYALFERKMRKLILLVLTKAFGDTWTDITISEKTRHEIKENNRGNFPKVSEVLEQFTLAQLESFLFEDRGIEDKCIGYKDFLKNELSEEKLNSMSKEEIISKINMMRPESLWNSTFSDIGDAKEWKERINSIRDGRNIVAHNKTMSYEKYLVLRKNLNQLNKDIDKAIIKIQDRDFSDVNSLKALNIFTNLISQMSRDILTQIDISSITDMIRDAVKRYTEPLFADTVKGAIKMLEQTCLYLNSIISSSSISKGTLNFENDVLLSDTVVPSLSVTAEVINDNDGDYDESDDDNGDVLFLN